MGGFFFDSGAVRTASSDRALQFLVGRGLLLSGYGRVRRSAVVSELICTQVVCLASAKHVKAHLEEQKPDGACCGVLACGRGDGAGAGARVAPARPSTPSRASADTHTRNSLAAMAVGASLLVARATPARHRRVAHDATPQAPSTRPSNK